MVGAIVFSPLITNSMAAGVIVVASCLFVAITGGTPHLLVTATSHTSVEKS